jgi:hypothetical protein
MERKKLYKNEIPRFDGKNYSFYRIMMKKYAQAQGFYVFQSVVDG